MSADDIHDVRDYLWALSCGALSPDILDLGRAIARGLARAHHAAEENASRQLGRPGE